jgi:antitoxin ParD1/3/4
MQTMNISLPDPMKQYVEEQVNAGGYSSASEYVRELVRTDQKRKAKEVLEQTLLAALNEGEPVNATPEWWDTLRQEVTKRAKARKSTRES